MNSSRPQGPWPPGRCRGPHRDASAARGTRARRYGAGATGAREPRDALTSREREALSRLGEGSGNAEIAERTGVAEGTVTPDVSQLLAKPGPRDRLQVSALARDLSLQAGRPTVRPSRGRSPVRPRLLLVQTS
ncbi:LuxR C-terminal-related transcriptional regulator [Streptomyces sp. NPDC004959]|uniref:response regulator transcription factor n=1 Tax=Streptomyces sp. NPDC004959 TaxID=3154673 RepID=UPI0033B80B3B